MYAAGLETSSTPQRLLPENIWLNGKSQCGKFLIKYKMENNKYWMSFSAGLKEDQWHNCKGDNFSIPRVILILKFYQINLMIFLGMIGNDEREKRTAARRAPKAFYMMEIKLRIKEKFHSLINSDKKMYRKQATILITSHII